MDLRPGPHEVIQVKRDGRLSPMRAREGRTSSERAFSDVGNFACAPDGRPIPGNAGEVWPRAWSAERLW